MMSANALANRITYLGSSSDAQKCRFQKGMQFYYCGRCGHKRADCIVKENGEKARKGGWNEDSAKAVTGVQAGVIGVEALTAPSIMSDEIQRILFICPKVHIYAVPPLLSNTGHKASEWKVDQESSRIFTARVRIIETATLAPGDNEDNENVHTDVRLEDPKTGDLFANCPYEGAHCVEQVTDSSRFFAVRVVDSGRKAMLGIGFEERSEAFDFGVSLQEVRRHTESAKGHLGGNSGKKKGGEPQEKKDYSLKEGETINITIGNKGRRRAPSSPTTTNLSGNARFPLPFLPPPPSAEDVKRNRQSQHGLEDFSKLGKLGFDDDAFGDFV